MDTNSTSLEADGLQVLKSLVTAVEVLTHDTSFKFASAVVEEGARLRKQIDSQQAEVTRLTEREKELETTKAIVYREMFDVNEREKLKNAKAQEDIETLEARIQENEQIIAELKKKTAGLETEVENAKHICEEEKKKLLQTNEGITKLQKNLKDQEKLIDELRAGGSKVKRAYETLQTKFITLETEKSRVEEEMKQKSSRLDELEGYAVQFNHDTETVLLDKFFDLWEFCTKAILVHVRKDIPIDRLQDPQAMRKLKTPGIIMPHQVPLPPTNTNAAKEMRLAVFMGLLARELADNIFQPLYLSPSESDILDILRELAVKDPKKESYCRAILLAMSPERQNAVLKERKKTFLQNVGSYLYDLLPGAQYDELRQSLEIVVERASETWRFFQYCKNRYEPDFDLPEWGDEEWEAFPFTDSSNLSEEQSSNGDADEAVLTIFPRLRRLENGEPKPVNFSTVLTKFQCSGADREWRRKEPSNSRAARANFERQRTRGMSISLGGSSDQNGSFLGDGKQASK